jgi:hypothetical protein
VPSLDGVQTFLPHPDFEASARALDQKRLGKQRVETIQVVRALTVADYGWANHPAALMWKGYEEALVRYGLDMCEVWVATGRADTTAATMRADVAAARGITVIRTQPELAAAGELPPWLGDEALHLSHRSALFRKDPDFYRPQFPEDPDDLPYVWPVRSPAVVEAERRRAENAVRREQRAAERLLEEAERARRRRSRAAKKAWETRRRTRAEGGG